MSGMTDEAARETRDAARARVVANIRCALRWRRITQKELAGVLAMSPAATSRRMRGIVEFDVGDLVVTSRLVGVPAANLLDGDPWEPAEEVAGTD